MKHQTLSTHLRGSIHQPIPSTCHKVFACVRALLCLYAIKSPSMCIAVKKRLQSNSLESPNLSIYYEKRHYQQSNPANHFSLLLPSTSDKTKNHALAFLNWVLGIVCEEATSNVMLLPSYQKKKKLTSVIKEPHIDILIVVENQKCALKCIDNSGHWTNEQSKQTLFSSLKHLAA